MDKSGTFKEHEPITAVMLGCGDRGLNVYGAYAIDYPKRLKFVACADLNSIKRNRFAKVHKIPEGFAFESDKEALDAGKIADAIFICTMDQLHENEVLPALNLGYHVFLEKPMAITEAGCREIVANSTNRDQILAVGHVLRYSPLFAKVKELIEAGAIGDITNIRHSENMATWVYAHSFVRGNWENSEKTSSLILQKGCHDLDLIYWFAKSHPTEISMFVTPTPFSLENAPKDIPERCTDGCIYSETCLYEAVRFYLQGKFVMLDNTRSESRMVRAIFHLALKYPKLARTLFPPLKKYQLVPWRRWPTTQVSEDLSEEGIMKGLREGPYGRCIYRCNNDQPVSHVVNILFENGCTATYILHGMSYRDGRELRIDGIKGTIKALFYNTGFFVELHNHLTGKTKKWRLKLETTAGGGGDYKIVDEFVDAIRGIAPAPIAPQESLVSHLMAFAAERSVKNHTIEKIQICVYIGGAL
jgi:predicted dehydrogenase